MKSVTEFWNVTLIQGLKAKEALAAEGKSPEEIEQGLGEKFKYEGDKLKYFINALTVAGQNQEKLGRVLVVSLNEGENAPPQSTKIDEMTYVPEFQVAPRAVVTAKAAPAGGKGGKGGRGGGRGGNSPKSSPWGLTPEEKAAKKGGAASKR